jgi:N-acetylglucosamine malate deacetylase 1
VSGALNPYRHFVSEFARVAREGQKYPLGGFAPSPRRNPSKNAPVAIFFSPHPDDESIGGGLALRLARECGWKVINVAVTLGSKKERRAERLKELKGACKFLGFDLLLPAPGGLERVTTATRDSDAKTWNKQVEAIAKILQQHQPKALFFPHARDWHGTHIGVHWLVMDALKKAAGLKCHLVETEFWGQMAAPNLLVEYKTDDVADLVAATSFHRGEVQRNPYHLRLPAWLHDNVRRGGELVGGEGGAAPTFIFAQLFRLRHWNGSRVEMCCKGGRVLPTAASPDELFSR